MSDSSSIPDPWNTPPSPTNNNTNTGPYNSFGGDSFPDYWYDSPNENSNFTNSNNASSGGDNRQTPPKAVQTGPQTNSQPTDPDAFLHRKTIDELSPKDFGRMQGVNPEQDAWIRQQQNAYNKNQTQQFTSTADSPDPRIDLKVPNQSQYEWAQREGRDAANAHERSPSPLPKQETPTPAETPPTPRNSGNAKGGSGNGGGATPRSAEPVTPMPNNNTAVGSRPSTPTASPPSPAQPTGGLSRVEQNANNAMAGGAALGIGQFANDLLDGRSLPDSAGHSAASTVGGALGLAACSELGVFAMVCGNLGANLGGRLYDHFFPRPAQLSQQPPSQMYQAPPPFTGGQGNEILYTVVYRVDYGPGSNYAPGAYENLQATVFGPVSGIRFRSRPDLGHWSHEIYCRGVYGHVDNFQRDLDDTVPRKPDWYWANYSGGQANGENSQLTITQITRTDGQPDTNENPTPLPLIIDNRTYQIINNQPPNIAIPRGEPKAGQNPGPHTYVPPTTPMGGTARGDSPDWTRNSDPAGSPPPDYPLPFFLSPLAPELVNPGDKHYTDGAPNNSTNGAPSGSQNISYNSATGQVTFITPGHVVNSDPKTNPLDTTYPRTNSATDLAPNPIQTNSFSRSTFSNSATPSGLPETKPAQPQPDAVKPTPTVTPPTPTETSKETVTKDDFESFKKELEKLIMGGTILAGLTPTIQNLGEKVRNIENNTTPESLTTAAAGTCRTTQPGGCSRKMMDDAIGDINQNTNNKFKGLQDLLNTILNGFNASLIEATWKNTLTINSKLGEAVPGGISGFMTRGFKMLRLGTIINWLTFIGVMHNALMLTSAMKDTLLAMMTSISQLAGFKDEHDQPLNFNEMFNSGIETLVKSIVGEDNYTELKKDWVKANRIYQATANMLSAVQSMMSGLQQGVELVGNYVALIGNGIKAAGGVSEKAYKWMSEKMHLERTSKFLQLERFESSVQKATDTISNFDMIAQSGVQLKDSYKQFVDVKDEFKKELNGEEEKKTKAEKEAKAKAKDPGYNAEALNSAKE